MSLLFSFSTGYTITFETLWHGTWILGKILGSFVTFAPYYRRGAVMI
jgi:hypothetical protein